MRQLTGLFGNRVYPEMDESGAGSIELDGYGYRWFRVGRQRDGMHRPEQADTSASPGHKR
jgi:hypothetical protein